MTQQDTIQINGVQFSIKTLTITFPNSVFTDIFEDDLVHVTSEFTIKFPEIIDPMNKNGYRYMSIIKDRIERGSYKQPEHNTRDLRFRSIFEFKYVIDFLGLPKNEYLNYIDEYDEDIVYDDGYESNHYDDGDDEGYFYQKYADRKERDKEDIDW